MASTKPGADNQQLLPKVVEDRAKTNPEGTFAKVPISSTTYVSGFVSVTNLQVSHAVDRVAWFLEERLGKGVDFPIIAYMGPSDLRYTIVLLAAIKAGYQAFFPSPRNSRAGFTSLLSRLNCKIMVATTPEAPSVPMILKEYDMDLLHVPSLHELLGHYDGPLYPYDKTFEEAKSDPIFVLHTSGSTGIPKPMFYTHEHVTRIVTGVRLPPPEGFQNMNRLLQKGTFFVTLPGFHIAGIGFGIIIPVFDGCIPVYPLPGAPPTVNGLIDAVSNTKVDWAFLAPVMIEEMGKDAALLEVVAAKLEYLYYVGGSVPQASGDTVASKINLYQAFGSSECGALALLQPEDYSGDDWNSIQLHPSTQPEFRHRFEDLYELVFINSPESQPYQPVFLHFPNLDEYETRDLFAPHPTKPGRWVHRSRIDDVIVFLNGEKTNPVSFEQEVARHPEVRSALVAGQQRFEASLLVELVDNKVLAPEEQMATIDRIWPAVQKANSQTPAHARVSKSKILLVDPAMPMLRAGKGTVQRQGTWNAYAQKLDTLYAETDSETRNGLPIDVDLTNRDSVAAKIHALVMSITEWDDLDYKDEFFRLGMDSLGVLRLSRELKAKLGIAEIVPKMVYANPSVDLLTGEIMKVASHGQTPAGGSGKTRNDTMAAMLHKYENEIDKLAAAMLSNGPQHGSKAPSDSHVIILTGSTGALGSFILQELLLNESVAHVYCFNRAVDSESIQKTRNAERGLSVVFPPNRVSFLTVDLLSPDLGLEKAVLDKILSSVTQIIHNAWPVDFNRTLPSFQSSLDGVVSLISIASQATLSPSILFLSSISSITNYAQTDDAKPLVPEAVMTDMSCPAFMGYGESKYLGERVLHYASRKLGLTAGTIRISQIAGTADNPRGWNRNEWLPSLVLSSQYIGAVPESLGARGSASSTGVMDEIDWIPVDRLAAILVEITFNLAQSQNQGREAGGLKVFHGRNPYLATWADLLPTVRSSLCNSPASNSESTRTEIKVLPFRAWLDLLRSKSRDFTTSLGDNNSNKSLEANGVEILWKNPGIKLLDFYESLLGQEQTVERAQMDIQHTMEISPALRKLEPVRPEWMASWVRNWIAQEK